MKRIFHLNVTLAVLLLLSADCLSDLSQNSKDCEKSYQPAYAALSLQAQAVRADSSISESERNAQATVLEGQAFIALMLWNFCNSNSPGNESY